MSLLLASIIQNFYAIHQWAGVGEQVQAKYLKIYVSTFTATLGNNIHHYSVPGE